MHGSAVLLTRAHASIVLADLQSTARYRGWELLAAAVMRSHVHVVIGVPGDPDPAQVLGTFKAYASRELNRRDRRPVSGTWWTQSGSRRLLSEDPEVIHAIRYVRDQPRALALSYREPEAVFG